MDKTEHWAWPYAVYSTQEGVYRFASEPVVADLDNDGRAEVLFASWVQKDTGKTGKLHVLNWQGQALHAIDLPLAFGGASWNGALAAPTLANIDGDADLEVVLNTAHSGFVAYDLPGTAQARILWGTGRGNMQRTGTAVPGPLPVVTLTATDAQAAESGSDRGRFRLTRTGNTASPLVVKLSVSGTAANGVDYRKLSASKTIPAGQATVTVAIVPQDDALIEGTETVTVRLAASDAYRAGSPAMARLQLVDND